MEILNKNEAGFQEYAGLVAAAVAVKKPEEGTGYPLGSYPLLQAAKSNEINLAPKPEVPKPE